MLQATRLMFKNAEHHFNALLRGVTVTNVLATDSKEVLFKQSQVFAKPGQIRVQAQRHGICTSRVCGL
jgi:hypothetical protein